MSESIGCIQAECDASAADGAPVALCVQHAAVVADWMGSEFGVPDLLPSACVACGARAGIHYPSGWMCAVCEWVQGVAPDGELGAPRLDVVYYIRFDDRIKIGTTSNLGQRMSALWHHELLAIERGGRARERQRHDQFAATRLERSEWFARSSALEQHLATLTAGVGDPWGLYARWLSELLAALA